MKLFITESALNREIFESWAPTRQKKYLKAHPHSKFNPNHKAPATGGAKGRPKTKISEKLNEANEKFNKLRGSSEARKTDLVKKLTGALSAIIGRRIDTTKMEPDAAKKSIANHVDAFLKKHAPAIHRSRTYKSLAGKGVVSREKGGVKDLAKKEVEIKDANFKPKVRLSAKAADSLKEAIKKYNRLRNPKNKQLMKDHIVGSLQKVYGDKVKANELDSHVKNALLSNGGKHLT